MSGDFANSHKHCVFFLCFRIILLVSVFLSESVNALNASKGWDSVTEAVVAELFGEKIYVCEGKHSDGILFLSLDWTNNLVQNSNCVILFFSVPVSLGAQKLQWDFIEDILADIWENFDFARLILSFNPSFQVLF